MKTILFSFADGETRDEFFELLRKSGKDLITTALNTVMLDPPIKEDHERTVAIWISGSMLHEGPLSEMNAVFDQELASHSASVIMKELRGGEWIETRARRKQG